MATAPQFDPLEGVKPLQETESEEEAVGRYKAAFIALDNYLSTIPNGPKLRTLHDDEFDLEQAAHTAENIKTVLEGLYQISQNKFYLSIKSVTIGYENSFDEDTGALMVKVGATEDEIEEAITGKPIEDEGSHQEDFTGDMEETVAGHEDPVPSKPFVTGDEAKVRVEEVMRAVKSNPKRNRDSANGPTESVVGEPTRPTKNTREVKLKKPGEAIILSPEDQDRGFVLRMFKLGGASEDEVHSMETWIADKIVEFEPGAGLRLSKNKVIMGNQATSQFTYDVLKNLVLTDVEAQTPALTEEVPSAPDVTETKEKEFIIEEGSLEGARLEYVRRLTHKNRESKTTISLVDVGLEDAEKKYFQYLEKERERVNSEVLSQHGVENLETLPQERKQQILNEVKVKLGELLEVEENHRKEGARELVLGEAGPAQHQKLMQFIGRVMRAYNSLSKPKKFAITVGLASLAGAMAGVAGTAAVLGTGGYAAVKGIRAGIGMGAGMKIRKKMEEMNSLSIAKAVEEGRQKMEVLQENAHALDMGYLVKRREEIQKETDAEVRRRQIKQVGISSALGMGTSAAVGFFEHAVTGGFDAPTAPGRVNPNNSLGGDHAPSGRPVSVPSEKMSETTTPHEVGGPEASVIAEFSPGIAVVEKGDSVWKLAKESLKGYEKFNELDELEQNRVLFYISDEVMGSPAEHGISHITDGRGVIWPGDELDLSKIIGSQDKLDKFIEKAQGMTPSERASFIDFQNQVQARLGETVPKLPSEDVVPAEPIKPTETIQKLEQPEPVQKAATAMAAAVAPAVVATKVIGNVKDLDDFRIRQAKEGMTQQVREAKEKPVDSKPLIPEIRSMTGDIEEAKALEAAFQEGLKSIYGRDGVDNKDWKSLRDQNAAEVLKFVRHDSAESALPQEVKDRLLNNKKHHKFINQVLADLHDLNEVGRTLNRKFPPIEPGPRETVEQFMKRLSRAVWEAHKELRNLN